jgi:threonine/homoserine/homoserine lactone efflux protein
VEEVENLLTDVIFIGFSLPNLPTQSRSAAVMGLFAFAALFHVVMAIYSSWYLLDGLYADRKDKSVLLTWIGILVGAALIALAIQLRVRRLEA